MNDASGEDARVHVWIDADGCPVRVRDIVFKAASKRPIEVTVVANRYSHPPGPHIKVICVTGAFDAADNKIVEEVGLGHLVITGDIPLADRAIAKGALALNHYGEIFTADSIKEKLALRNLRQELRSAGEIHGGGGGYDDRAAHAFAAAFDRTITKMVSEAKMRSRA